MRRPISAQKFFGSLQPFRAQADTIEWEELPSMADALIARRQAGDAPDSIQTPAWDNTMPADLLVITPPQPFRETVRGLATREVYEPDVFRHFFGSAAD